jgi:hypothetical protein
MGNRKPRKWYMKDAVPLATGGYACEKCGKYFKTERSYLIHYGRCHA